MPRLWLAALLLAAACAVVASPAAAEPTRTAATLEIYGGVGSWLDIFAGPVWRRPDALVAALRANGVRTLYLQTSNYSQRVDVVDGAAVGALVDAAHADGVAVVAWYLPSLADLRTDTRRVLAALRFRTPAGGRFDSFALDIEASIVHPVARRNARLLALSDRLRAAAPAGFPLGAIIPSPVGMARHPHYWPSFPYAALARRFDVFLPMAYFSHYVYRPGDVYRYAHQVIVDLRAASGDQQVPIHMIGGLAAAASTSAVTAFVHALDDCGVIGASLYAFPQTTAAQWSTLAAATFAEVGNAVAC